MGQSFFNYAASHDDYWIHSTGLPLALDHFNNAVSIASAGVVPVTVTF